MNLLVKIAGACAAFATILGCLKLFMERAKVAAAACRRGWEMLTQLHDMLEYQLSPNSGGSLVDGVKLAVKNSGDAAKAVCDLQGEVKECRAEVSKAVALNEENSTRGKKQEQTLNSLTRGQVVLHESMDKIANDRSKDLVRFARVVDHLVAGDLHDSAIAKELHDATEQGLIPREDDLQGGGIEPTGGE